MRFRNFPDLVLGSKTKLKVLLHLLAEPGMPTSEREIARLLGTSHTAVNKVMKDFYDAHLVTPIRIGNVNAWKLNEKSYAYWAISDIARLAKYPPLEKLKEDIKRFLGESPQIKSCIQKAVIFGSIAEGKESPGSDIDLLIVVNEARETDTVAQQYAQLIRNQVVKLGEHCVTFYGNSLAPQIYSEGDFKKLPAKKIGTGILVLV